MSAIVGERDRMIINTVPRFQPANDRVLLLAATAQAFKVAATTIAAPASIDFTAGLVNMQGQVTFTASNASVLTRTGNVATLAYAGMVGDSVTVTATIVVDGLTFTASQTVSKIFDGVTGNSARVAYSKTTLLSLASAPATISTQGDASFPPINTWGAGTVWEGSPPLFGAGESLYRSDGIFNPASGTTKWAAPYLNALKVGNLEAINTKTGNLLVTGTISDAAGNWSVNSAGQAVMKSVTIYGANDSVILAAGASGIDYSKVIGTKPPSNATAGATFGVNIGGQMSRANIGSYIQGAAIDLALINTASISSLSAMSAVIGTLRTATDGARTEIWDNVIKVYDGNNMLRVKIGDLTR